MTVAMTRPTEAAPTAIAPLNDEIAVQIRAAAPQFAPFLPAGTNVEQIVAAVFLEAKRVPQIKDCSTDSIIAAATSLVSWGFDIGRTGYLVPFKGKCTPVIGFKGMIEMALASGAASSCDAREVYEGDHFEFSYGTEAFLRHVPGGKNAKVRGRMTHFYVVWKVRYGYSKFDVMTVEEVEAIRQKYSKQWNRGELEPWYGIKTVIRRSAKHLPQNPKLAKFFTALQEDEIAEFGEPLVSASATVASDAPRPVAALAESSTATATEDGAAAGSSDTGEDATDAQRTFMIEMSKSHVWTEKERAALLRHTATGTKARLTTLIDKTNEELKKRKNAEAEARQAAEAEKAKNNFETASPALAGTADDELPF